MRRRTPALLKVSYGVADRTGALTVVIDKCDLVVTHHPANCGQFESYHRTKCSYIFITSVSILLFGLLILPLIQILQWDPRPLASCIPPYPNFAGPSDDIGRRMRR